MRARIEPVAGGEDLDIPMPAMTPAYRMAARKAAPMDPATRRLAIFAGGIGGALVLLVGIWSFTGHHQGGVPVIEPDSRPMRVKPANPGGMQVAGANDAILSGDSDTAKQSIAPPPETPEPQALKAEEQATAHPATPPAAAMPPAPAAPPRAKAGAQARTMQPPPPPARARRDEAVASARPAQADSGAAGHHTALVQLAALESEGAARSEWHRLERRYGELLNGHEPTFSHVEHAGKTFWRVRVGGFADTAQAMRFCERVKAKGGGCAVASF